MNPLKLGLLSASYGFFWICINAVVGRLLTGDWPNYFECIATAALVIAASEAVTRMRRWEDR